MGRVEYAFIKLEDDIHADEAAESLGDLFEACVDHLGIAPNLFTAFFVTSGLARAYELRAPGIIPGKDGLEQAEWMLEQVGMPRDLDEVRCTGFSVDNWLGQHLCAVQFGLGVSFREIFARMSYEELRALRFGREDWGFEDVCALMAERIEGARGVCPLGEMRRLRGLTQAQLARRANVPLRTLQQYEQGAKDLRQAAAVTVHSLARALGCSMESLLAL